MRSAVFVVLKKSKKNTLQEPRGITNTYENR